MREGFFITQTGSQKITQLKKQSSELEPSESDSKALSFSFCSLGTGPALWERRQKAGRGAPGCFSLGGGAWLGPGTWPLDPGALPLSDYKGLMDLGPPLPPASSRLHPRLFLS